MAVDNYTILHDIWLKGTNDYQQRIPEPTQSNIQQTMGALFDPMNQNYYNQFMDALIMRIGTTYVHQQSFRNPLREFKKPRLMYGATIQEMIPKWIRAHSYIDDAEDVFKMARPDARVWYHSQNRRDRYDITINDIELRTAFTESNGLNKLISSIMKVPINSDEYDEYRIMMQMIAIYEQTWGFYKHALSAAPTDESTGKEFLQALRTYAGLLKFPSTTYNNGAIPDIPIFVNPNELILLVTPQTQAALDVQTLSVLFHMEKAEIEYRTILVDQFPIADNNCVALLTTTDFFMCADTEYRNTSIWNPKTLGTNYFLHHWGVYSVSPFVPAIMFTVGGDSTTISEVTQTVSGITLTPDTKNVSAGDTVELTVALTGNISPATDPIKVAPNAATYATTVEQGATEGTAGVYTATIGGTWAASDTVAYGETTVTVTEGETNAEIAAALATALASDTTYTVTASNNVVTFTEKSGKYATGAPTITKTTTAGTVTVATTTAGVAPTDAYAIISPRTRVDEYGILHVAPNLNAGAVITVEATSTYINPSGSTTTYSDTGIYTVV